MMRSKDTQKRSRQTINNTIVGTKFKLLTFSIFPFLAGYLASNMMHGHRCAFDNGKSSSSITTAIQKIQQQPPQQESLALQPRAMQGQGCSLPLECAWSLDSVRTQIPSMKLYERIKKKSASTTTTTTTIEDYYYNKSWQWDEPHYNILNERYESSDPDLLSTGIVKLNLPASIHVIPTGGEAYFRRSLRDADMIIDGFLRSKKTAISSSSKTNSAAEEPAPGEEWLDFGGSHGRLTQILAAAYPETTWYVCDPIQETVQWASQQLPNIHFHVMPTQRPPLPMFQNNQFSGIYALSIWSHYSEEAALVWFQEMHRILKPGGRLWFSTHGFQALNFAALDAAALNLHGKRQEMLHDLYIKGHFYYPMFGTQGDWGVSDGQGGGWWGYGAFLPEWLAAKVLNARDHPWRLDYYGPGVNEKHQDVYVLSKLE